MSDYLSLEQAAAKLGVNYSAFRQRKAIRELAKSTNFICQGSSHTRLYPIDCFPDDVKTHPALRAPLRGGDFSSLALAPLPAQKPNPKFVDPDSKESRLARASRDLLKMRDDWCRCQQIFKEAECDRKFAAAVEAGTVQIGEAIRSVLQWGSFSGISRGSLRRMRDRLEQGKARSHSRPKAKKIDEREDLANYIVAYIHDYAHANMTVLRRELVSRFADVPSLSTLSRWVDSWKADNASSYLKATNPDQWKNKYMVAFGSQSDGITQPNQLWQLDSTPADILLIDGRYSVIAVIDVFTRRANLLVSHRSKAEAIISLMRQTILLWGAPQAIKTDNGSDYTSNAMSNACGVLAVYQELCPPYSPEKKPHIERFLGTFNHDWLPTLPGYAGHNVETRQAIRSQRSFADNRTKPDRTVGIRLTAQEFQNACSNWVAEYNDRIHTELEMKSPNMAWNEARFFPRYPDLRTLDPLLAFQGERSVGKQGISYEGGKYVAVELNVGDKVQISIDAHDMGRIYVFDLLGQFICEAVDPALVNIDRQKVASEATRRQKAQVAEGAAKVKHAKSGSNFKQIQKEIVAERTSGKVVDLPAVVEQPVVESKVVSINKPRTATPEELFDRAWSAFAAGQQPTISAEDANRIFYGVTRGDCGVLLDLRASREQRKEFMDWLSRFAPAAQKKA